jgi:hypothetical protein
MATFAVPSTGNDAVYWLNIAQNMYDWATDLGLSPIVPYPYPGEPENTLIRKVASLSEQIAALYP